MAQRPAVALGSKRGPDPPQQEHWRDEQSRWRYRRGNERRELPLSGPLRPRSPNWNWARPEPQGRDRHRVHEQVQLSGAGPLTEPHLPLRCACRSPLGASPRARARQRIWPLQ